MLDRAKQAPVENALHHTVDACGARQSCHLDLIDIALADWDVRHRVLDMEGLPVNDTSATLHDGGSSLAVDSHGIGGRWTSTVWLTSLRKSNK